MKKDSNNFLAYCATIIAILVVGIAGIYLVYSNEVTIPQTNPKPEKQVWRVHLLDANHQITGTYYFIETYSKKSAYAEEGFIAFTDHKGRGITYSGDYLVTPVPDTLSN